MVADDFARLWFKFSKDMKSYMDARLTPSLTEGQLYVLELLSGHEKMKPSDFIEYLVTTPAAVTTLLDRMEKAELIVRIRDEKDRRIVWVQATEKGKTECGRGLEIRQQFLSDHLDKISSHNQQLLLYLLGKVAANAS